MSNIHTLAEYRDDYGENLPFNRNNLLIALGANVAAKIKQGEIHRLILPIFLHANVFHTFFNVFFQLRMGFTLEKNYGILKIIILYFVAGIYGNILSSAVTYCPIKVGASTSGISIGVLYNNQMENKPSWYDHMKMASYATLALLAVVPPIVLLTVPRSC
ncbi:rhomboid protease ROM1, putative (ROM1) [Plasmodium ovale wallikeri]|uniref:Rhomboid-like protease n=1 Tax=Plasmodium ovale wallikeri TaxID=864142 RepID=A0A1A8YVC7_PLAOA|nr:rhomboid protease ROM1, putative (ROM1) [Plasmodium ovale wallikeri]SBT35486.1 rhomboid protease ROM1, putative (ROM1) [Plasmodium ovale wallikeri]